MSRGVGSKGREVEMWEDRSGTWENEWKKRRNSKGGRFTLMWALGEVDFRNPGRRGFQVINFYEDRLF